MEKIERPAAEALVRWRSPDEGGRRSGPPTAPVYMATALFVLGDDSETQPGWPESADQISILLQKVDEMDDGRWRCLVGFLVPELANLHLRHGAELLVFEGPRAVAAAEIHAVLEPEQE